MSRVNHLYFLGNVFLLCSILHADVTGELPLSHQTIIEDSVLEEPSNKYIYLKDSDADRSPDDASILYHIPGLSLTQSSGHLGASEITYRGLTSSRLTIDLEGLNLNNPATGQVDANAMFLFAADRVQTDASSLSIFLPRFESPFLKTVMGMGSQNAFKAGISVGKPIDKWSSLFLATQLTSTNGNFDYLPDGTRNKFSRENNDQHRLQALANYQRHSPLGKAHGLVAVHAHQGGIPGFAAAPTKNLRTQSIFTGMSAGVSRKIKTTELSLNLANSLFDYSSSNPPHKNSLVTSTHELTFGLKPLTMPTWLDMEFAQKLIVESAHSIHKTRIGTGLGMKRTSTLQGRLKPKIVSNFLLLAFQNHGFLFKKDLGVSIEPTNYLSLTARMANTQRLPTFMELYANDQFNVGNESLKQEGIWDFELGSSINFGHIAHLQITGFLGYLSDAIVYVPFFDTKIRAINTNSASRHGVDLGLTIEPTTWMMIESKNSILRTKIADTKAPLPKAPPFLGLTKIRFGHEDNLNFSIQSRYRAASSANIHGTLKTPGYLVVDASVATKIMQRLGLSFLVTNIFNDQKARDTYEMPLPSTTVFGQIEIGNI